MIFKILISLGERVSNKKKEEEESGFEPTPRWAVLDSNLRGQQKNAKVCTISFERPVNYLYPAQVWSVDSF